MTKPLQQPPSPARVDVATFVACIRKSGLIGDDALARALGRLQPPEKASTLARFLIGEKLLTKFQAERLLVGRTEGFVMGQYRILDQIGRGGMGRVFKAEHMTMSRIVALKILSPHLTKTERARDLFQREVRAAARLSHPNLVTSFDANQVGDRYFLVMEYVDGPNLFDLVKEHGPLAVGQACEFIRQAAHGLQYAHDLGMVHRDIKPHNLLVHKNPGRAAAGHTVKVLDFGLARLHAPEAGEEAGQDSIETVAQSVMGTPDYLSPEQARDLHAVDGRSDLYALGCTFYYLLTGQVPFPGGTTVEKLVKQTTAEPVSLRSLRPEVPHAIEQVVAKLMAKEPALRYQSAAELVQVLAACVDVSESSKWVPVAPRSEDNVLPPSGIRPLPPRPLLNQADPWAHLDAAEDGALTPTLPNDSGNTPTTTPRSSLRPNVRRPVGRRARLTSALGLLWLALVAGVLVGAFVTVRLMMAKVG